MKDPCKNCNSTEYTSIKSFIENGDINNICNVCAPNSAFARPEFVPQAIRDQRVEYWNSTVQPYRGLEPSREFIDAHPKQAKKMFNEKQIKNARDVWTDTAGYNTRKKSK